MQDKLNEIYIPFDEDAIADDYRWMKVVVMMAVKMGGLREEDTP